MSFLASDVMSSARLFLNDVAATLFTNTALLPYCIKASEELELILAGCGVQIQRTTSAAITVAASSTAVSTLTLPSDFLFPIDLNERASGSTNLADYTQVIEKDWEPNIVAVNTLNYYAFRNNSIYFPPCTVAREVQLRYIRQLAQITASASPMDSIVQKNYLSAKTAELAARYVGMNGTHADDLAAREVGPAEYQLLNVYVQEGQANPQRRRRFQTRRLTVV
jgi:hypothetical protein